MLLFWAKRRLNRKQRVYLKRLEIQGFKSFAQKTALEFAQGMIAIVGPNGSGKSNVADSLRWVLGEQSAKMVRGKKSDDVIFAGSEKKAKMGFAEVSATFDNRDRRIPLDAAEVSIGRRVDRSGESTYLINGQVVRLLDVVDLVLKSGIGTSRYTVIGQGTIDQMILAGPAEIKSLLDEASGVKAYHIKRERTLRRLEQTAQNLMRAEDLLGEIEPRLKGLRRQAKKAEARAEVETELKIFQREYFGSTYWQLHGTVSGFEQQLASLRERQAAAEGNVAALRRRAEQLESQLGEPEELKILRAKLGELQDRKNRLLEDLSLVRGKAKSRHTGGVDAATLQLDLSAKERRLAELSATLAGASARQEELGARVSEFKNQLREASSDLTKVFELMKAPGQVDWSGFEQQLGQLEQEVRALVVRLNEAHEVTEAQGLAAEIERTVTKFLQLARKSVARPQVDAGRAQGELERLTGLRERVSVQLQQAELELSKAQLEQGFVARERSGLEQEILNLGLELKKASGGSHDDFVRELLEQEGRIQADVTSVTAAIAGIDQELKAFLSRGTERQAELRKVEQHAYQAGDELSALKDQAAALGIEKAKHDTQMEVLVAEISQILGADGLAGIRQQPVAAATEGLQEKIMKLRHQLELIGGIDELTMQEYRETEERYTTLSAQVEDLKRAMADLEQVMNELDGHIKDTWNDAFERINEKFEYYFRVLFNGGRAYLSPVKEEHKTETEEGEAAAETQEDEPAGKLRPEERVVEKYQHGGSQIVGVDMKATPPGKKLANIQALSGGERSLTSIALLCSLLTCFPSPFVVLDEVDAALDDANTVRFGQILGTLAHQTQFITITHNRETMSQSGILYGGTMGDDGVSKLLSVKLDQAAAYAK